MFEKIPNKVLRTVDQGDVWPQYGRKFELNKFYRTYEFAAGFIGDTDINFWSVDEIKEYERISEEFFGTEYKIFGGDGGGTHFGFAKKGGMIQFFEIDAIALKEDIIWIGDWKAFLDHLGKAG